MHKFTAYLHEHIPLTAAIGAEVIFYDGETLQISAPLEPNLNHRNTAFGGSLSALAILSGWGLIHLKLKEEGITVRLVIQKSVCDFSAPIDGAFRACARAIPQADWSRFLRTFQRHGRARIRVTSELVTEEGTGGTHLGTYVAERQPT